MNHNILHNKSFGKGYINLFIYEYKNFQKIRAIRFAPKSFPHGIVFALVKDQEDNTFAHSVLAKLIPIEILE